jgi:hypothetical protein
MEANKVEDMSTTIASLLSAAPEYATLVPTAWPNQGNTTELALEVPGADNSQTVSGINIFWVIFIFTATSSDGDHPHS